MRNISPESGSSRRLQHLRKVDFPEPEGPRMNTISLLATSRVMLSSTILEPKDFDKPRTSKAAIANKLSWVLRTLIFQFASNFPVGILPRGIFKLINKKEYVRCSHAHHNQADQNQAMV